MRNEKEFLFSLLREKPDIELSKKNFDWDYFFKLTCQEQLDPIFYKFLKEGKIRLPSKILNQFKESYLINLRRNLLWEKEFEKIKKVFQQNKIPFIPLKGFLLSELLYQDKAVRKTTDLDILIKKEDLEKADLILKNLGYEKYKGVPEGIFRKDQYDIKYQKSSFYGPFILELHFNFVFFLGRDFEIEKIWQKAKKNNYHLTKEDLLIYLSLHFIQEKTNFLKNLLDIKKQIELFNDVNNWKDLLKRAKELKVTSPVYFALKWAKALGAFLPSWILEKIYPPFLKRKIVDFAFFQKSSKISSFSKILIEAGFLNTNSKKEELKFFFNLLFPSKKEIAFRFKKNPSSPFIYFYYPYRMLRWILK